MSLFDLIEEKRRHVREYMTKVPPREIVEDCLWKAWKTSPSKNNFMAYRVDVYGPDKHEEKEIIWNLVLKNHIRAEERAQRDGRIEFTQKGEPNPFYEHVKLNPYLFVLHSRVAKKANRFYAHQIERGHFADQMYPDLVERLVDSVAVDCGLFLSNLTAALLEHDIDVSYNSCFLRDPDIWRSAGLDHVEYRPIVMMSAGYAAKYRHECLTEWNMDGWDVKPDIEEVIKWVGEDVTNTG